ASCTHCGSGIEFDAGYVDHMIICPHCGRDTVLGNQNQGDGPADQPSAPRPDIYAESKRSNQRWVTCARGVLGLGAALLIALICYGLYSFLQMPGAMKLVGTLAPGL